MKSAATRSSGKTTPAKTAYPKSRSGAGLATRPRSASDDEIRELVRYRVGCGEEEEDANIVVRAAGIAVFPRYQTGCPGYCGKVMVVVYDSGPEEVESYIWLRGNLTRVHPEE